MIALVRGELSKHHVSIQMRLADGLSPVHADRVQLQQVMLNLILNAIEAMISVGDEARELVISTESSPAEGVLVTVGDSVPASLRRIVSGYSNLSSRPSPTEWELAFRSVAQSSTPIRDDCGWTRTSLVAPSSDSHCRLHN